MSTRATGISELGRLLSNVFHWGSRSSGSVIRAADDVVEETTKKVAKSAAGKLLKPLDSLIKDNDLRAAGLKAAKESKLSFWEKISHGGSKGAAVSDAQRGMQDYIKTVGMKKYSDQVALAEQELVAARKTKDIDKVNLAKDNLDAVKEVRDNEISSFISTHSSYMSKTSKDIGNQIDNGGLLYRGTAGLGKKTLTSKPVLFSAAAAAGGMVVAPEITKTVLSAGYNGAASVIGGIKNYITGDSDAPDITSAKTSAAADVAAGEGGQSSAWKELSEGFNYLASGLEYAGLDPTTSKAIVAIAGLLLVGKATSSTISAVSRATLGQVPAIGGVASGLTTTAGTLATYAGLAYLAYQLVTNTDDVTHKPQATAALSAPAPAMP